MPLPSGHKLGAYEIVCPLGAGGMGEVYRARDARLGRDVALKVLPPEVVNEPGRLERFDREARAVAALNHPHIVTIFSTEEAGGVRFLTMELVDGCTLSDLVMPGGMAMPRFLDIAIPLADALAAAHQKQITHRDLKPGNVMVSNDGRVKVLDFGLARVGGADAGEQTLIATQAPITHQGTIIGTMPYMSPEQVEGRPLDPRSDLFSLGVIFHELLSGERPFKGSSSPALMSAILRDTPASVAERRADVPAALDRLLTRLLEKRPDDRVQTARDVYNELRHIQRSSDPSTRPTPKTESGSPRASGALSVAVLPLVARSPDDDSKALADGLTDDITSGLSRFGYLRVLSRSIAERLAREHPNVHTQARYAVEGHVRKSGPSVRVGVTLVDTQTGTNLWTHTYERDGSAGAFAVQDQVSSAVVATIGDQTGVLMRAMASAIVDRPIEQLNVAELVVRYHGYTESFRPDEHLRLREAFERALEREPRAAEGWACLAMLYEQEHGFGFNRAPDTPRRQRHAAERATEIDPYSQQAWVAMASVFSFERDLEAFKAAAERAVSINPLNADMVALIAVFMVMPGEYDRAAALIQRALELKSHHPGWYHFPAFSIHYQRGEYEQALRATKATNMPLHPFAHLGAAAVSGQLGRLTEARAAFDALRQINSALLEPEAARHFWSLWIWRGAAIDHLVEGFLKARDLVRAAESRPADHASIAVLPFADLSEKKDQDWFCDGIAEEILNALAPLPGLRVAARTSAFSFRGKSDDLRAIADKLQVTTVLEGSVRRAGDRVRITTQLSDAREGRQLWSERFDREVKDIFDVQEEIARAIADRLRVTLGGGRLVERPTANIEAYQLLLKGRMLLTRRGRAIFEAIPCFERVIALDPGISDAHALLGDAHRLIGLYGLRAAHETMPLARASVERALAIDPNQVEALATLANLAQIYEWDFAAGIALSARALAINPDHVRALAERAITLSVTDPLPAEMLGEALSGMARARTLDPLNAWVVATEAFGLAFGGRPEQAVANAIEAVALDPSNFTAHWALVWTQAWLGRLAEVQAAATTALAMSGRHPMILAELAAIESLHGDRSAAGSVFEELQERAQSTYIGFACRAAAAASAGRLDTARALIKEAITARDSYLTLWKLPAWRPFWKDAECAATLRATSLFVR